MPITAPTPDPGNAPEGILEPPEPVVVAAPATIDLAPMTLETLTDVPQVAPEPMALAPGVYTDGVLTANVDETGAIVPITEADFDAVPLADLADLAGRYLTQELTPKAQDMPEATP